MKKNLVTMRIFHGVLTFVWIAFLAMSFLTGGFEVSGALLAVAPVLKAVDITDSEKLAAELNKVFGVLSEDIKKSIAEEYKAKGALSIDEIDAKFKTLGIEAKTLEDINKALETHGAELLRVAGTKEVEHAGMRGFIKSAFATEGLAESIRKAHNLQGSGLLDVTKAVGTITTGQVTTDTGGNALLDMLNADEIMDIRLNTPFIEEFANVSSTSKPVFTYVDYVPGEGDVDFIAEGGVKPQLDLDITVKTESPVKAAGYEILTEESMQDIPRLESNARGILLKKYLLKRQNGILFGDGIGANPLGLTAIAGLFNPASWTGPKVKTPNMSDAIVAAATQIYTTVAYTDDVEYYPNVVFVNPGDFAALRLSKDANGQYIFPNFSLFNDKTIEGIRVVSKNKIPAGKILIGDFQKLNIIDYIAYSVRIGWINDQFIKNLFTMLGEGRFFVFVKNLDQRAFIYDDIANIVAGIEEVIA